ncbi:cytochrome P450 [Actinomadura sp. WMMB 499]|nr:cytochrome P450 [Actinomadura sp. WMMB 499]
MARHPGLRLAADPATLPPVPSLFTNSASTLPVHL